MTCQGVSVIFRRFVILVRIMAALALRGKGTSTGIRPLPDGKSRFKMLPLQTTFSMALGTFLFWALSIPLGPGGGNWSYLQASELLSTNTDLMIRDREIQPSSTTLGLTVPLACPHGLTGMVCPLSGRCQATSSPMVRRQVIRSFGPRQCTLNRAVTRHRRIGPLRRLLQAMKRRICHR